VRTARTWCALHNGVHRLPRGASALSEAGEEHDLPSLEHVIALTDDVGIAQHAHGDVPNRHEGYCTDDVARALIVALMASESARMRPDALRLARIYLAFLAHAQRPDGRFHNFMSYERTWLDDVGSQDSNGRAIWALGYGVRNAPRRAWRELCERLFDRAVPHVASFDYARPRAYAALGLVHAFEARGRRDEMLASVLRTIGDELTGRFAAGSAPGWDWFEPEFTYDNARLCEALVRIGTVLDHRPFVELAVHAFAFYESVVVEDGTFVPIGNAGWYRRGGPRARYAQQPLEATAFVDAALALEAATGDLRYRRPAASGVAWFRGRNSGDAVMVAGGGCCDGLGESGVNDNMGAESTLAYLASVFALAKSGTDVVRIGR
jgi:hypothetical protein